MSEVIWLNDFEQAKTEAMKSRKPILLQFDVEGCGGCKKLYSYTYKNPKVTEELNDNFILLQLNIREARDVRRKYSAYWTPSFYVLDFKENLFFKFRGYFPPEEFRILLRVGFAEASIPKGKFDDAKKFLNKDFDELSGNILAPKILVMKGIIDYLHDRDNKKFRSVIKQIKEKYPQSPEASQYFWEDN
jgi:thioredoxin-related protein